MIKFYLSIIFLTLFLACNNDESSNPTPVDDDDPIEEEEEMDTTRAINPEIWVDPFINGDENTELRVHVWFDSQLIDFDDTYNNKTSNYSGGRKSIKNQLVSELKALNESAMLLANDTLDSLIANNIIHSVKPSWIVNGFTCYVNEGGITALSYVAGVHSIFRMLLPGGDFPETGIPFFTPNSTDFTFNPEEDSVSWNIDSIQAPKVWEELGITGRGSKNVVHDFGFSFQVVGNQETLYTNPNEIPDNNIDDDGNGYIDDYHGFDFENQSSKLNTGVPNGRGSIHGNSVATIICGRKAGNTVYGVAPNAKWAAVLGQSTYAENVEWAIEQEFDTYTMSFSIRSLMDERGYWRKISEHAALCGLFVISGAGNNGNTSFPQIRTPEDIPYAVFCVAGIDQQGNRPLFSSMGPVNWDTHHYNEGEVLKPDFSTYNTDVRSIDYLGNGNISLNGNSFAGPHLAGVISLMLEADPELTVWGVRAIFIATAEDILDEGLDRATGYGLIDAYKAVQAVL